MIDIQNLAVHSSTKIQLLFYIASQVEWLKNNKPVKEENPDYNLKRNTETGVCRLEIDEVFPEDAARYSCRATNEAGKAETTCMLSVMGKSETQPSLVRDGNVSFYLTVFLCQLLKTIPSDFYSFVVSTTGTGIYFLQLFYFALC